VESPSYAYVGTELYALAEANNYYQSVISRFAPFIGKRVIEIGAGIGTFSRSILTRTTVSELVMVGREITSSPSCKSVLRGSLG
jgi:hypothetical protein